MLSNNHNRDHSHQEMLIYVVGEGLCVLQELQNLSKLCPCILCVYEQYDIYNTTPESSLV